MIGVTGSTMILGIAGNPVNHSLSPVFQNHMLKKAGLDGIYVPFQVGIGKFDQFVDAACEIDNFTGLNVTIPFKHDAFRFCRVLSREAKGTEAVNTIFFKNKKIYGYNTDIYGILITLRMRLRLTEMKGARVVISGAGGGARAALYALQMLKPDKVVIANRSEKRSAALIEWARKDVKIAVEAVSSQQLGGVLEKGDVDLFINATPLGLKGEKSNLLPANYRGRVFDMAYGPGMTPLVRDALKRGCMATDGFDMLVAQGVESFRIWTGIEMDRNSVAAYLKKKVGYGKDTRN